MSKSLNKIQVLAKQQTVIGVDAGPVGLNAIQARNIQVTPLDVDTINTGIIQEYFGASPDIVTARRMSVTFECLMAPSGTAGTAPAWGVLMKMAGFSETVVASTHVDYLPVSTGILPGTLYVNLDGLMHKAIDVYLDIGFDFNPRGFPVMRVSARGAYIPVTDEAFVVTNFAAWQQPKAVSKDFTTFTYFGENPCVEALTINTNSQVTITDRINCAATSFNGRSIEGALSIEMVSVAEYNWLATQAAAGSGAFSIVHGLVAGDIIETTGPKVQSLPGGAYGDAERTAILNFTTKFLPNLGNDELRIRVR